MRGDSSSSGHGGDGFNVRSQDGEVDDFVPFSWLLRHNLPRIWISFRYHPHDSAFGGPLRDAHTFGARHILRR